tara:strand:- start:41 stop:331 length:291 start_codon:yes stop_codon:yes gene_type:complete
MINKSLKRKIIKVNEKKPKLVYPIKENLSMALFSNPIILKIGGSIGKKLTTAVIKTKRMEGLLLNPKIGKVLKITYPCSVNKTRTTKIRNTMLGLY